MANIHDYMRWRGDLSFDVSAFNDVDALVLAALGTTDFTGIFPELGSGETITMAQAYKKMQAHFGDDFPCNPEDKTLIALMADSVRFGDLRMGELERIHDVKVEEQFGAFTAFFSENDEERAFIVFEGTGTSILGYKEDLNMAFMPIIPSQLDAVKYYNAVGQRFTGKLYTGGHSKGGNLAIFGMAYCEQHIRERVERAYNFDGPGFCTEVAESAELAAVRTKVRSFLPQSSIIGLLLEYIRDFTIIKSTNNMFSQHDPYSWQVEGTHYIELEEVANYNKYLSLQWRSLVEALEPEKRQKLIHSLFEFFNTTNARNFDAIGSNGWDTFCKLVGAWWSVEPAVRRELGDFFGLSMKASVLSLRDLAAKADTEYHPPDKPNNEEKS